MRWLGLAVVCGALWALPALAQTACIPNPNAKGFPYDNGCPLTASGINVGFNRFGSDPRMFGAKGDGVTDDTAAIQLAINDVPAGGAVSVSQGFYCVKSGPLTITNQGVTIQGKNRQGATVFSTCGADAAILAMSGAHDLVQEMQFIGSPVPGTTKDVIAMNSGCNECTLSDVRASGGRYALNATNAYEIYVLDSSMDSTYGQAIVYLTGTGGYIRKGKFDQAYPFATPSAGSTTLPVPAWASSHSYSAGNLVSANGYILQATVGGTSGLMAPVTPAYGSTVIDGGVTWGLVGNTTYYGVQCDTACGFQLYITESDFSADETAGIGITNTLSGSAPHGVVISKDTFGSNLYENVLASAGYEIQIVDNISGGGLVASGGSGISLLGTGDDNIVSGNLLEVGGPSAGATGVFLDANNTNVENNICSATTCVSVAANINHFRVIGNSCFSGFGASQTCVLVAAGTSDFYDIIGNDAGGTTTSINDQGTGVHKNIIDAVFNTSKFAQHLFVTPTTAPVIASGFGSSPTLAGSDGAGRITVGTGGASTGAVTFGTAFPAGFNPACIANDETTGNLVRASATTTTLTISGTMSAADTVTWVCVGY